MLLYKQDIGRLITKTDQNFNPGLVLIGLSGTGPWTLGFINGWLTLCRQELCNNYPLRETLDNFGLLNVKPFFFLSLASTCSLLSSAQNCQSAFFQFQYVIALIIFLFPLVLIRSFFKNSFPAVLASIRFVALFSLSY